MRRSKSSAVRQTSSDRAEYAVKKISRIQMSRHRDLKNLIQEEYYDDEEEDDYDYDYDEDEEVHVKAGKPAKSVPKPQGIINSQIDLVSLSPSSAIAGNVSFAPTVSTGLKLLKSLSLLKPVPTSGSSVQKKSVDLSGLSKGLSSISMKNRKSAIDKKITTEADSVIASSLLLSRKRSFDDRLPVDIKRRQSPVEIIPVVYKQTNLCCNKSSSLFGKILTSYRHLQTDKRKSGDNDTIGHGFCEYDRSRELITESSRGWAFWNDVDTKLPSVAKRFDFKSTASPQDLVHQRRQQSSVGKNLEAKLSMVSINSKLDPSTIGSSGNQISATVPPCKSKPLASRTKSPINIVIAGHVDAGKSTLIGHILVLIGQVSQKEVHKLQRDSELEGKSSFKFAWMLDSSADERGRGVTIDVGLVSFELPKKYVAAKDKVFVVLDAPGHKDFVGNMISGGASKADYALLVVDARPGEFESGFGGGQTREHVLLCRALGVQRIIVVVNKMDVCQWSRDRFEEIKGIFDTFLQSVGYQGSQFIPISAFLGLNIDSKNQDVSDWYRGECLLVSLAQLETLKRPADKPFRLMVADVQGTSVSGYIESGFISNGQKLLLMPSKYECGAKAITNLSVESSTGYGQAGDMVLLNLNAIDSESIHVGNVLCHTSTPRISDLLKVKIISFDNVKRPIISGLAVIMHYGSINVQASLKLLEAIDRQTGAVLKRNPRVLTSNCAAVCELKIESRLCVEVYDEMKEMGRFTLRSDGLTIAAGVILEAE